MHASFHSDTSLNIGQYHSPSNFDSHSSTSNGPMTLRGALSQQNAVRTTTTTVTRNTPFGTISRTTSKVVSQQPSRSLGGMSGLGGMGGMGGMGAFHGFGGVGGLGGFGKGQASPFQRCDIHTSFSENKSKGSQGQWTASDQGNGKATIKGPGFEFNFDKSQSSVTTKDQKANDTTKIWGDPHETVHVGTANEKTTMFNGDKTNTFSNGVTAQYFTTPDKNNPNVSYTDKVIISQNGRAIYEVDNLNQQDTKSQLKVIPLDSRRTANA